jgi:hypothetical protein
MPEPRVNHCTGATRNAPPTTVFMLLAATAAWQALPRCERDALMDDLFVRVFNACPGVSLRQYDAAAFDARGRAVLMWEVSDTADYREAVSLLHEHELLTRPHFEVAETIVAAELAGAG